MTFSLRVAASGLLASRGFRPRETARNIGDVNAALRRNLLTLASFHV
jgi:hypothetical protein